MINFKGHRYEKAIIFLPTLMIRNPLFLSKVIMHKAILTSIRLSFFPIWALENSVKQKELPPENQDRCEGRRFRRQIVFD
jgi:hypothetical protein